MADPPLGVSEVRLMAGLRGLAAAAGIGATRYYKRGTGQAESRMLLEAVLAACEDAGLDPRDVDGFTTYGDGHDESPMLATSLGIKDFRFSVISSGGGGGGAGAIAAASAAVATGLANNVIVFRALAQAESGRQEFTRYHFTSTYRAQGVVSAVQSGSLRTQRMIEAEGVPPSVLEAFTRAVHFHGSRNPEGLAYGKLLSAEAYAGGRMIVSPQRVYDCSRESDGAMALLITSDERAREFKRQPAYILGVEQSGYGEDAMNSDPYPTAGLVPAAKRLWENTGYGPEDVDVAQVYENTTGPAVQAVIDHGFTTFVEAEKFFTFDNLVAPCGRFPVNTDGGNISAGFVHGMGLSLEAVRQIRGTSVNQVPDVRLSLFIAGPQAQITGSVLFGTEATL
jgi:acetyl-CoA acetyltransferase